MSFADLPRAERALWHAIQLRDPVLIREATKDLLVARVRVRAQQRGLLA